MTASTSFAWPVIREREPAMSTAVALGSSAYRAGSLRQVLVNRARASAVAVWCALEATGRRRAAAHLNQLASHYNTTQPELAASLRRAASFQA
jgi:hypothetical protein